MTNTIKATASDQIEFTSLRPMEDAPRDGSKILISNITCGSFIECAWSESAKCFTWKFDEIVFRLNETRCFGWIPMPTYKPEKELD